MAEQKMWQEKDPRITALAIVRANGCFGAKEYVARMLAARTTERGRDFWRQVQDIVEPLNCRQARAVHVARLFRAAPPEEKSP